MDDISFTKRVESINKLENSLDQPAAPKAQVKGNEKATKKKNNEHPFKGRLVGEHSDDYDFLTLSEEDLGEDFISKIKQEMKDVIKPKSTDAKPKKFNRGIKGQTRAIQKRKGETRLDSDGPLFDNLHEDSEIDMAYSQMNQMIHHLRELHELLKNTPRDTELEAWVQSKLTLANDYLSKVTHHLESNLNK